MAYAVIEFLMVNFALNPLFCKTDVSGSAFIYALIIDLIIFSFVIFLQFTYFTSGLVAFLKFNFQLYFNRSSIECSNILWQKSKIR
ncbi:MAG TPA: hypothetical protein DCW95_08655 [Chryseobacterium sp.]|nr:hypothetical protein [Chryseobacterium sp.]